MKHGTGFPTGKVLDVNFNDIIYDFGKNMTRPSLYILWGNKHKNVPASLIRNVQLH